LVRPLLISSFVIVGLLAGAGRAICQARISPSPAVFGGAALRDDVDQDGLNAVVELFQAYEDYILPGEGRADEERQPNYGRVGGLYSGLGAGLQYVHMGDRGSIRSWANSAVRFYPSLHDLTAVYHQAGARLSRPLGRRVGLYVSPFAAYSPRYAMHSSMRPYRDSVLDQEPLVREPLTTVAPDLDFAVARLQSVKYGATVGARVHMSPASNLNFNYGYRKTDFDDQLVDQEVQVAGVHFAHRFSRNGSLKLGYLRQEGNRNRVTFERQVIETIDIGMDYRKPLGRTRRTFVRFGSGSVVGEDQYGGKRMQLTGHASLAHQIGRTWLAILDYRRDVRYIDGFESPISADFATATLQGLTNRHLELLMDASFFTGTIGFRQGAPRFDSFAAGGRARTALNRTLAAFIEYRFYHYRFDDAAVRPIGMPPQFNRSGARVGLSLYVPLMK
jgi:hypothetical protein